jgi:cytochrome c553
MRHLAVVGLLFASGLLQAGEPPVDNEYFEKFVRPVLVNECVKCHEPQKQKGGLRLDTRAAMTKGGDTGPALNSDNLAKSHIIEVIRYDGDVKMPPAGKLKDEQIQVLTAWVKAGAPWPEAGATAAGNNNKFDVFARAKLQWAYQPVRKSVVPAVKNTARVTNPIDSFLLAKLEPHGLTFAPPAEKRVLLRRVYFDLTGLPPTADEIDAFLKDNSPDAYEKVVEKLLASPHYGERWGRHWLDLVRYAETHGHEFDFEISDAWRYRDYVIRAFNADVPYDQLLTEHVAGDLLPSPRRNPKDNSNESVIGTGFWFLYESKHSPVDSRADQADRIDNQIDVFGKTFLGTTISCARCHDHKFDPIATKDYYALYSVLSSSRFQRASIDDSSAIVKVLDELKAARKDLEPFRVSGERQPTVVPGESDWRNKATAFEKFDAGWRSRWDADGLAFRPEAGDGFPFSARESLKLFGSLRSPSFTIDKPYFAIRVAGKDSKARFILNGIQLIQNPIYGPLAQPVNHGDEFRWMAFDLRMWKGQSGYLELLDEGDGFAAISEAWFADSPPPAEKSEKVTLPVSDLPPAAQNSAEAKKAIDKVRELESKIPPVRRAPAMRDGTGVTERVFIRGNHKTPGIEAPRSMPEVYSKPAFTGAGSGRLNLARAMLDPANPLVARVMVNRIWLHHFGEGIVRSPDDFGKLGQEPTHPELLDWLANEFISHGWSVKHMHRLMVLSAAYRQSSQPSPDQIAKAVTADPQNKLLHRANVRRLEAEAIRDSILTVSGRLDRTMEGPGVLPYLTDHQVGRGKPASGPLDGNGRRSVYLQVRRNFINPMFSAFDYPTPFTTIGRRSVSNVPAQALAMMNNPFVIQQAELWAKRVLAEPSHTSDQRVAAMYIAAFGRTPTAKETSTATTFIAELSNEYGKPDHPKAWTDLAHVLFNAKEFIFVE